MAISRSLMNRQLRASGGIMNVTPRENFGLGSSLKKFVRKIIPNEISEIATKAAPFVAPFNPLLAAGMSGIGTFDQTGSIGDSLKAGGMNYALGQGARYIGGGAQNLQTGFNPFSGYNASAGLTRGLLTNPVSDQGGLGKFFSNQGTQGVQGIDMATGGADGVGVIQDAATSNVDMITGGADGVGIIQDTIIDKSVVTKDPGFLKNMFDGISNQDYGKVAQTIGDGAKKFGKAMFTNKDGSIDKAAVLGAVAFTASYAEAKALAADAGVEITPEEYDESRKAEKQEEYAGYLTNFFGGQKDGGRIGYESGANEYITRRERKNPMSALGMLGQGIDPTIDESDGKIVIIMTEDGPQAMTESEFNEQMDMDKQPIIIDMQDFLKKDMKKDGGRIGYEQGANELMSDIIMRGEMDIDDLGIRQQPSTVLVMIEGPSGVEIKEVLESDARRYNLNIVSDSGEFADKGSEIDFSSLGKKDGGRINRRFGSPEEGEGSGVMEMLSVDVDAGSDEEEENMTMAYEPGNFTNVQKSYMYRRLAGMGGKDRSITMPDLYKIFKNPGKYPADEAVIQVILEANGYKNGGRIGLKDGTGGNRVSELLILRDSLLANGEDVSDIEAEIFQLTGKAFKSVGGISDIPTGKMKKNNAGVVERDYRDEGGFVPVGIKERADDVPAMLSKNEFVMTADAVRGLGNGSVEEGSKKLYNTMKQAEQKGKIA
jgi:hypothetical protein